MADTVCLPHFILKSTIQGHTVTLCDLETILKSKSTDFKSHILLTKSHVLGLRKGLLKNENLNHGPHVGAKILRELTRGPSGESSHWARCLLGLCCPPRSWPLRPRRRSLRSSPARAGWNERDLTLLSHSAPVEGEVMLLSTPGAWQFSWGVHYPRCPAFHPFSAFPGSRSPCTPAPLRLNMGLRRHGEEGSELGAHDIGQGQMTLLSLFTSPI